MGKLFDILADNYIYAVVRGKDEDDGYQICKAAVAGGIKNLEVTFSTPNAAKVIADLREHYKSDETIVVGAGTVMSVELAEEAYQAGAQFLVSPHLDLDIAHFAQEHDIPYMPGCATVTEIVQAMKLGCEVIKIFPGGQLGPSFIKNVHGPIPEVKLMPSGGVSLDNIKDWRANGAVSVGVGSALSAKVDEEGYGSVTEIAKEFVAKLAE